MDELTTFVYIGDNEHDDAADGVTQLAITLAGKRFASKSNQKFYVGKEIEYDDYSSIFTPD